MADNSIKTIEGAESINALIEKVNGIVDEWDGFYSEITKTKTAALTLSGLDKTPGANITHVLLGLVLSFIADLNMSMDDVKKQIKFTEEKPFIKIDKIDKYEALIESIPPWMSAYFESIPMVEDLTEKLKEVPDEAVNVFKEAPTEFEELDMMAKAVMLKNVKKAVG